MNRSFIFTLSILLLLGSVGTASAIHTEVPAETTEVKESSRQQVQAFRSSPEFFKMQALINLLVQKGIITEKELTDEIVKMKHIQK